MAAPDELKAERKAERKAARKAKRKAERKAGKKRAAAAAGHAAEAPQKRAKPVDDEAEAARAYLALHEIVVSDGCPPPCLRLDRAPFPDALRVQLGAQGFASPSPVQSSSWPIAATGRDVLAIAKTGSGKTLGFLLPVLARCVREKAAARGAPLAIIMAPTRELALQIKVRTRCLVSFLGSPRWRQAPRHRVLFSTVPFTQAEADKFGKSVGCAAVAVYGGASRAGQVAALRRGCQLIIGTPGRIKDVLDVAGHCGDPCVSVSSLSMLVLDEADRMLDMGFEKDMRNIVWYAFDGRPRQTFLFSATWPLDVQGIAADFLTEEARVTIGAGGQRLTASATVKQRVHVIQEKDRLPTFTKLMAPFCRGGPHHGKRVIVFANRKTTVKKLVEHCARAGLAVERLSGDRSQSQRESTVKRFKAGTVTCVIATDVAARGLDIKGIARVINYELPSDDFQDYVHRIGRTGRAGETGEADSLFTDGDRHYGPELVRIMREAGQAVPPALARLTPQKITFDWVAAPSGLGVIMC